MPDNLRTDIEKLILNKKIADDKIAQEINIFLKDNCCMRLNESEIDFSKYKSFWPPRLINAFREKKGVVFFGAGMSIPCGLPSWNMLLSEYFGLEQVFLDDEDLKYDPLTMAELASQKIGHDILQSTLRSVTRRIEKYSINHVLLSALRCPIYLTTNYDSLFEEAWKDLNGSKIPTILNSADLARSEIQNAINSKKSVLFKIYGCVSREDEYLILSRKDYRTHYRVNKDFFNKVIDVLRSYHVLFLGFSHKDPGISRLVEDIIYEYENKLGKFAETEDQPHYFSLQFDMHAHTPEIFAARGLVALKPASVQTDIQDIRTQSLGVALSELVALKCHEKQYDISIYQKLKDSIKEITNIVELGISQVIEYQQIAISFLNNPNNDRQWIKTLQDDLDQLASQGVYLTNDQGKVVLYSTPDKIPAERRKTDIGFSKRPYFQQAKSFRKPFISDSLKSVFNQQSTFFLCVPLPLTVDEQFVGLLFSACQIGQWSKPIEIAESFWKQNISFLIIDSNGLCLLPPNDEFSTYNAYDGNDKDKVLLEDNANLGYDFNKLLAISQRDNIVKHISNSVVPLSLDDDVLKMTDNYTQYSILSDVNNTRWKLSLSIPIIRK